jgi:fluoroquinolone transport system permease protein
MRAVTVLVRTDLRRVGRDTFLMFMMVYPWLMALLLRRIMPWLADSLADRVALADYFPLAACLVAIITPNAMGIVLGFQLLEEKDARCLAAVAVTPLSLDTYVGWRVAVYSVASAPLLIAVHQLLGIVRVPLIPLLLVALASATAVPLMALIIAGLASNQVEGFAVMKASGILMMGPLASWFVPRPWDLVVGVLPTYWPVKAYFAAVQGETGIVFIATGIAVVFQGVVAWLLFRRFRRRVVF